MKKSSQVHRQSVCSEQKTDSELTTRATTPAALLAAVLHPYLQPVEIEGAREREREKQGWRGMDVSAYFYVALARPPRTGDEILKRGKK